MPGLWMKSRDCEYIDEYIEKVHLYYITKYRERFC